MHLTTQHKCLQDGSGHKENGWWIIFYICILPKGARPKLASRLIRNFSKRYVWYPDKSASFRIYKEVDAEKSLTNSAHNLFDLNDSTFQLFQHAIQSDKTETLSKTHSV